MMTSFNRTWPVQSKVLCGDTSYSCLPPKTKKTKVRSLDWTELNFTELADICDEVLLAKISLHLFIQFIYSLTHYTFCGILYTFTYKYIYF